MNKIKIDSPIHLPNKKERHKLFGSVEPGPKTKPIKKEKMADIQNIKKDYLFDIDAVGVNNVKYPIIVKSELPPTSQTTIGTFSLTTKLNKMSRGTNMSRFLEQLEESSIDGFEVCFSSLSQFAKELQNRMDQEAVLVNVSFPWFYERRGPISNKKGLNHSDVTLRVHYSSDQSVTYSASLTAMVTTLCPCSKEISEYSAHSQRGCITMEVTFTENIDESAIDWKKVLLNVAETNASAMIHPVLKRPDEKQVTETAYENPRFVEDVVRLVAADLYEIPYIRQFKVTCQNEESIHLHDAIATIEYSKEDE